MTTAVRGLALAGFFATSVALGCPAVAAAEEAEWDIEAYDACMAKTIRNADLCCVDSGGVPTADPDDTQSDGSPNCYAPPAETDAEAEQEGTPPRELLRDAVIEDLSVAPASPAAPPRRPDVSAPAAASTAPDAE
jgi:hypothetical protein